MGKPELNPTPLGSETAKRCIVLARTANTGQGRHALVRQVEVCRQYAAEHDMQITDEVVSDGMSSEKRLISSLVERKRTQNDFRCMVVTTIDRTARSYHSLLMLKDAGIEIFEAANDSSIDNTDLNTAAIAYCKVIAAEVTRGMTETEGQSHE